MCLPECILKVAAASSRASGAGRPVTGRVPLRLREFSFFHHQITLTVHKNQVKLALQQSGMQNVGPIIKAKNSNSEVSTNSGKVLNIELEEYSQWIQFSQISFTDIFSAV
jgi:hypothetical protein